jgi:hypothetical protein
MKNRVAHFRFIASTLLAATLGLCSCKAPLSSLVPARAQDEYLSAEISGGTSLPDRGTLSLPDAIVDSGSACEISLTNRSNLSLDLGEGLLLEGAHLERFSVSFLDSPLLPPGKTARISLRCLGSSHGDGTLPSSALRIRERSGLMPDFLLYLNASPTSLGSVSTLAGPTESSNLSRDGIGRKAGFSGPDGIASDGSGLFTAENKDHTIRRVDLATSAVTTVAGTAGKSGSADGIGSNASFKYPRGVACDGSNLYVGDSGNYTIRKIDLTTMNVSTLAGSAGNGGLVDGTGPAARFGQIMAMCIVSGYLYVAENSAVRRVDCATGAVLTIAGNGTPDTVDGTGTATARFKSLQCLASVGDVLYLGQGDYVLRRLDLSSAAVTTVAGSRDQSGRNDGIGPAARFGGIMALAEYGGLLYVIDAALRRFDPASLQVTTLSGYNGLSSEIDGNIADARCAGASGMCRYGTMLYYAGNSSVRRIDIDGGSISTLAGNSIVSYYDALGQEARFSEPYGLACCSGTVYACDFTAHVIRKIDPASGKTELVAGLPGAEGGADGIGPQARFRAPVGLASDGATLYVADMEGHTIRSLDTVTREVKTLAGSDGVSGSIDGQGSSARFKAPYALACGEGKVFVADTSNYTIRSIDPKTGTVSTLAGAAGSRGVVDGIGSAAQFYYVTSLAYLDGYLYAGDGNLIRRVDPQSGAVLTLTNSPGYISSFNGIFARNGSLFITEFAQPSGSRSACLRVFDIATNTLSVLSGYPGTTGWSDGSLADARFAVPYGITGDAVNLYVSDYQNHNIRKLGRLP